MTSERTLAITHILAILTSSVVRVSRTIPYQRGTHLGFNEIVFYSDKRTSSIPKKERKKHTEIVTKGEATVG
jgi:hypothetical protein